MRWLHQEDAAGNVSVEYGFTLTNILLGDNDLELVILLDGEEVTHITAGNGSLNLKVAFKSGSNYIEINENSVAAARVSWSSSFIVGSGSISSDGSFTGESGSVGLISAKLDNYYATAEVIPTSMLSIDAELSIPDGGYVYDGAPKEPEVITNEASGLEKGVDYTVTYLNNINAGTATVVITSLDTGKCSGSKTLTFEIAAASISDADIALEGKGKEISVKVGYGGAELVRDKDYTLTIEYNEDANAGLVTVSGIGNYTGIRTRLYDLNEELDEDIDIGESDTDVSDETETETDENESETDIETGNTETEIETDNDESETEIETGNTETDTESSETDTESSETDTSEGFETESDESRETETEGEDPNTTYDDGKGGWFAENAVWVILLGVVVLGGVGVGVYFLFIKDKRIIEKIKSKIAKKCKDQNDPKTETEEKSDSEK